MLHTINKTIAKSCTKTTFNRTLDFGSITHPSRGPQNADGVSYEFGRQEETKEYIHINCSNPEKPKKSLFLGLILGKNGLEGEQILSKSFAIHDKLAAHQIVSHDILTEHPAFVLEANSLNRILLKYRIVQKLDQKIGMLNTYFEPHVTRTGSGVAGKTDFCFAWSNKEFVHMEEVEVNGYRRLINFSAVFFLAAERLNSLRNRLFR